VFDFGSKEPSINKAVKGIIIMIEDDRGLKSQLFLDFKDNFKSVIVDEVKYYVVECDILLDENELYAYFLRQQDSVQPNAEDDSPSL
jgi:hypothetical protein